MTGIVGWVLAVALADSVSELLFGNIDHSRAIGFLGATLLMASLSSGMVAVLQGFRRIGDVARANVLGMMLSAILTVALIASLGEDGIVPAIIGNGLVSLLVSWMFSRRVGVEAVPLSVRDTLRGALQLFRLGVAFAWGAVLVAGVDFVTRSLIAQGWGIDAVGFYQAAWALSGLFAGFILNALGADFYPRLSEAMRDPHKAVQVVNEQTEIAILLALPGLLFMLAFAPLLIRLLYSQDFLASAPLLPWFLLGVFGRVVSWPLGYIQVAKGEAGWFLATQTLFAMIYLSLLLILVPRVGIAGAAYAFVLAYCLHFPVLRWVGSRLIGFRWSKIVKRLLLISAATVFAAVAMRVFFSDTTGTIVVAVIFIAAAVFCVHGLATRLGPSHSLVRIFRRIPLVASLIRTNVR